MNLVQCIKGSRCAFFILLGILVIACILMGLSSALGDRSLVLIQVFKGIALMSAVCWFINLVTLVMLLSQAQLQTLETEEAEEEEE